MRKLRFLLLAQLVCLTLTACGEEKDVMEEISSAPMVKVESAEDGEAVIVSNEITKRLLDLTIQPSDEDFTGDWLYRFTYSPAEEVKGGDEIVVLFGEENMQIDGVTYVAEPGVPYGEILDWAALAYDYSVENYVQS